MKRSILQDIVSTSKHLRKKFKNLREELNRSDEELQRTLRPITEPLYQLTSHLMKPMKEEPQQEDLISKSVKKEYEDKLTTNGADETSYVELEQGPSSSTPLRHKQLSIEKKFGSDNDDDDDEESEEEKTKLTTSRMQEILKSTPEGRKILQSRLQLFQLGPLISPYMEKYITGDTEDMDTRYGIRMLPQGGMTIGNSKVTVTKDIITIGGEKNKQYKGTPGLYQLLFLKEPRGYNQKDLEVYKEIVELTNTHRQHYSKEKPLASNRGLKYKNIISPLFKPKESLASTKGKSGKGYNWMQEGETVYEHWDDPNELIDRLRLLLASTSSGHKGHQNEINSIIEELREANIIY